MPAATYRGRKLQETDPKQALYMNCDNRIVPVAVHRTTDKHMPTEEDLQRRSPNARILPNEFGDGLRFSVLNIEATITHTGKNFNVFQANNTNYYLEYHSQGPHEAFLIDHIHHKGVFRPIHLGPPSIASTGQEPNATWLEPETFRHSAFRERDRGGGCCVKIVHDNQTLLVGISHTRTIDGGLFVHHQYLSRLYAFEQSPPFNIVARTGLFCLGHGKPEESRGNVHVGLHDTDMLQIHKKGKKYHCPAISFVTSIVEHATDASLAIISYGVNDCYPRMMVVEKVELTSMLFPH